MTFCDAADSIDGQEQIDRAQFTANLRAGLDSVADIGAASVGDKTLMDTLVPAVEAMEAARGADKTFDEALSDMQQAAEAGRDSTIDMVAKIGCSSRLRGVLDAGATSCHLILTSMADGIRARL
jgi:dihydroxyacetone kinase-like protein